MVQDGIEQAAWDILQSRSKDLERAASTCRIVAHPGVSEGDRALLQRRFDLAIPASRPLKRQTST
jgi:hypothetical protein